MVAEYRLHGNSYELGVDAGLDLNSRVLWVKRDRQGLGALYRALAAQLVFKPAARPLDLAALELVLDAEVDDSELRTARACVADGGRRRRGGRVGGGR